MEADLLRKANIAVRKMRPVLTGGKICEKFYSEGLLEICFLSRRCSRDQQGACMMCDYGAAQIDCSNQEYIREMEQILQHESQPVDILLLCTNGSFFDDRQISRELFCAILEQAGASDVPTINLEAHYLDVTREKLEMVNRLLPGKEIVIEIGLETIRMDYHEKVIMKGIDLSAYDAVIALIRSFGFGADVNIMVGLPFLSTKEQMEDVLHTIHWVTARGGRPVLFPLNVKPYTLLMEAYHAGFYRVISQWLLLLILDALPEDELEQVIAVWYGGREEDYGTDSEHAVFPHACRSCSEAILKFYREFAKLPRGEKRKNLLLQLFAEADCQCLEQAREEVLREPEDTFEERYTSFLTWLSQQNAWNRG